MRSFRQLLRFLLPYWALDDEAGGGLSYSLAAMVDVQVERARSGMEQRFPSRAGPAALSLIGRDRLIARGRDETDAHYASRLAAWRYPRGHRVRGNVFALLEQVSEYFGGTLAMYGIDYSGNIRARAADGTESYSYGNTWDWGYTSGWARQWLVIDGSTLFREQPDWGDAALWGGALGVAGTCIGIRGSSAEDWRAIERLLRGQHRWLPAGTQGEWLVVMLDGSTPVPDSSWLKWGKLSGSDYIPARDPDGRYVAMRAALKNYAGDTDWANQSITSLGTIDGDPTDWPDTVTMPDGSEYTPDDTDFSATITLPDDGDLPL